MGTRAPTGAKTIAPSKGSGGSSSEYPAQAAPKASAKALAHEGVEALPLVAGHLGQEVGRRPEAVKAYGVPVPHEAVAPEADKPGTHPRGEAHGVPSGKG